MDNKQIPSWDAGPMSGDDFVSPIQELDFEDDQVVPVPLEPENEEPEVTEAEMTEVPVIPALTAEEEIPAIEELSMEEAPLPEVLVYPLEEPAWTTPEPAEEAAIPAEEYTPDISGPEIPSFMENRPEAEAVPPETEPDIPSDPSPESAVIPELVPESAVIPEIDPEDTTDAEYRDSPIPAPDPVPKKGKNADTRPTLKGRPRRKKGEGFFGIPNILVTVVWLSLILVIGVTLGRMLWICAADVLAFGREDKKVTITVYEADTMEDVVNKLYDAGLIRYKGLFSLYASISDAEEEIKPGIYDLNTRYDYHALVNFMSPSSSREVIELTIPEGYTCRQIFALLEENRVCTAQDIAAYAADGELSDYWFLEGLDRGSEYCLEGYLFPDTYQFYKNSSPREALEKMLDNFEYRFSEEMRAQIDVLNTNVTDGTYGIREVVIVASLIEKESAAPAESPTIASVIYNRLFNWDYPALLNIDAAIVYAQGGEAEHIDTSIDSPYNTYRYTGLTPTAISNPGLASLKAALNPESTNYYYYVLNPSTGMHQFSKTQAEHDDWIAEFYN